ncbi:MAG: C39 family peptidase, partial [Thermomicrobiales bacterium]|nr:C39 family peptidase [Thermomicrobiales bacterium]
FGAGIDEEVFRQNIAESPNPHWGYRGYIDGGWGGVDDYGIYPEALAPTLRANGFVADVFYAGDDASQLTARLDDGMPTLVWLSYLGETPIQMDDAGSYQVLPGMHVVTAYGYDDAGVYVANPANGGRDFYTWGEFMTMWAPLDGMALGVAPIS